MARETEKTDKQKFAIEPTIPALPDNFSREQRPPDPTASGSLPYVVAALVIAVAAAFFWLSGRRTEPAPKPAMAPAPVAAKPPAPAPRPTPAAPRPETEAATPTPTPTVAPTSAPTEKRKKKVKRHPKKATKAVKPPRLPTPPPPD